MFIPPDREFLPFLETLENLENTFKQKNSKNLSEIHLDLQDLTKALKEMSAKDLLAQESAKSLAGRIKNISDQITSIQPRKMTTLFERAMIFLGVSVDLQKDIEDFSSALKDKIVLAKREKDWEALLSLASMMPGEEVDLKKDLLDKDFELLLLFSIQKALEGKGFAWVYQVAKQKDPSLVKTHSYYIALIRIILSLPEENHTPLLVASVDFAIKNTDFENAIELAKAIKDKGTREECFFKIIKEGNCERFLIKSDSFNPDEYSLFHLEKILKSEELLSLIPQGERKDQILKNLIDKNLEMAGCYVCLARYASFLSPKYREEYLKKVYHLSIQRGNPEAIFLAASSMDLSNEEKKKLLQPLTHPRTPTNILYQVIEFCFSKEEAEFFLEAEVKKVQTNPEGVSIYDVFFFPRGPQRDEILEPLILQRLNGEEGGFSGALRLVDLLSQDQKREQFYIQITRAAYTLGLYEIASKAAVKIVSDEKRNIFFKLIWEKERNSQLLFFTLSKCKEEEDILQKAEETLGTTLSDSPVLDEFLSLGDEKEKKIKKRVNALLGDPRYPLELKLPLSGSQVLNIAQSMFPGDEKERFLEDSLERLTFRDQITILRLISPARRDHWIKKTIQNIKFASHERIDFANLLSSQEERDFFLEEIANRCLSTNEFDYAIGAIKALSNQEKKDVLLREAAVLANESQKKPNSKSWIICEIARFLSPGQEREDLLQMAATIAFDAFLSEEDPSERGSFVERLTEAVSLMSEEKQLIWQEKSLESLSLALNLTLCSPPENLQESFLKKVREKALEEHGYGIATQITLSMLKEDQKTKDLWIEKIRVKAIEEKNYVAIAQLIPLNPFNTQSDKSIDFLIDTLRSLTDPPIDFMSIVFLATPQNRNRFLEALCKNSYERALSSGSLRAQKLNEARLYANLITDRAKKEALLKKIAHKMDFSNEVETLLLIAPSKERDKLLEKVFDKATHSLHPFSALETVDASPFIIILKIVNGFSSDQMRTHYRTKAFEGIRTLNLSTIQEIAKSGYFDEEIYTLILEKLDVEFPVAITQEKVVEFVENTLKIVEESTLPDEKKLKLILSFYNTKIEHLDRKSKEIIAKWAMTLNVKRRSLGFLLPTLLKPTSKGLIIPTSAQNIPIPSAETSLEELKNLQMISPSEKAKLLTMKQSLGLTNLSTTTWFLIYQLPESSRLEHPKISKEQRELLASLSEKQLSEFWDLNLKEMIEEGCSDLYTRIQNQAPLWNPGQRETLNERQKILYERMNYLTRHLLHHTKEVPSDRDTILYLLAGMSGRCEGIITELEALYRIYCLKEENATTLDAALQNKGFFMRQHILERFINAHGKEEDLLNVHYNSVFKNEVAKQIGMPRLLEGATEQDSSIREIAKQFVPSFLEFFQEQYIEQFSKTLLDILTDVRSREKIEVNHQFELFSELVLHEMVELGYFEVSSEEIAKRREEVLSDLKDPDKAEKIKEELGLHKDLPSEDLQSALEELNPDPSEKTIQNKMLLYPIYRKQLTQEKVASYLADKGLFEIRI